MSVQTAVPEIASVRFKGLSAPLWIGIGASLTLFLFGLIHPPSLGDEIHHYRFAKNSYESGGRALYDTAYPSPENPGFHFSTEAAWPVALAWIWRLTGGPSFPVAQAYHVLFYALLLFSVYQLAAHFYGRECAFWSLIITASMPMMASFGILFYMDLPATAFAALCFLFLFRKQYFFAGLALGIQYLMKRSAGFFVPAVFLLVIFEYRQKIWQAAKSLVLIAAGGMLAVVPDMLWRKQNLPYQDSSWVMFYERFLTCLPKPARDKILELLPMSGSGSGAVQIPPASFKPTWTEVPNYMKHLGDYTNSHVFNAADDIKYFGIIFFVMLAGCFFLRCVKRKDIYLWIPVLCFAACAYFLRLFSDIRYVMPAAPFLAILAAKAAPWISKSKWGRTFVIVFCGLQFFGAAAFTVSKRQIKPEVQEAFESIRKSVSERSLIMYPETNLTEYAGLPIVWSRARILQIFWGSEDERAFEFMQTGIGYIAIKKDRVFDDRDMKVYHVGGYPATFVEFLESWKYAVPLYENSAVKLFKLDQDALRLRFENAGGLSV